MTLLDTIASAEPRLPIAGLCSSAANSLNDLPEDLCLKVLGYLDTRDAMTLGRVNAQWRCLTSQRPELREPLRALCTPDKSAAVYRRAAQGLLDRAGVRSAPPGTPSTLSLAAHTGDARLFACMLGYRMNDHRLYDELAKLGDHPAVTEALLYYAAGQSQLSPEGAVFAAATHNRRAMAQRCIQKGRWSDATLFRALQKAEVHNPSATAALFLEPISNASLATLMTGNPRHAY